MHYKSMDMLKPCRYCGGKAIVTFDCSKDGDEYVCVQCTVCGASSPHKTTYFRLYSKDADHVVNAWNRSIETTAMRLALMDGEPYRDEAYDYVYVCENCRHGTIGMPNYCPECGRKVDIGRSDNK